MQHRIVRKGLVVGIIGILVLVCIPQNVNADGLPDLIVEDIKIEVGTMPKDMSFEAKVKNIGEVPWGPLVELRVNIVWMFLGIVPIKQVYSRLNLIGIGSLDPGESQYLTMVQIQMIDSIRLGTYRFEVTVNPNQMEDESNHFNNDYSKIYSVIFGYWLGE